MILGVFFAGSQFYLAASEAARKNLLTASEHLHDGYLSAATELEAIGDRGLQVLVDSVDPDGRLEQKAWPASTRAALAVLARHDLRADQKAKLVKDIDVNLVRLNNELTKFPGDSSDKQRGLIKDLYCVQIDLQQAAHNTDGRLEEATKLVSSNGIEPHC